MLTQVYFPRRYWDYVALRPAESCVVLARDLVLVAVLAALVYAIQRSTASSSERASSAVSPRSGAQTSA